MLGNLIDNAMDACDRDDPWVEVTVSQNDHTLLIRVADSGPGMDAATFEKAMQRGYSTKSGTDTEQHGLGLALVAQVVKRHNGTLTADVTYGSVVTVTVSELMISVLIVEDEPLIAEAHQAYLQRLQGFSVAAVAHTARDAMRAAAEAAANETPIDLVLLDIGLPDASGIALASGLSGLRPAPDIIAITSERDLEMVRAAVGHGALAYLLKPFTFAAFRDRLERYQRYREALPAGTDAASQAEVDRALAELRVERRQIRGPEGCGRGYQRRDRARGKGFRRRGHRRRRRQAGRRFAGDGMALPRAPRRRGHRHPAHRLRQGRPAEDPLPVALRTSPAGSSLRKRRIGAEVHRHQLGLEFGRSRRRRTSTVMAPAWSAMYSRVPSGLTATHDGSAVTVSVSTIELVSVHSTATCS